jgi:hypothetical protein
MILNALRKGGRGVKVADLPFFAAGGKCMSDLGSKQLATLAIRGALVTGAVGLVFVVIGVFMVNVQIAGVGLIAAAISFAGIVNAVGSNSSGEPPAEKAAPPVGRVVPLWHRGKDDDGRKPVLSWPWRPTDAKSKAESAGGRRYGYQRVFVVLSVIWIGHVVLAEARRIQGNVVAELNRLEWTTALSERALADSLRSEEFLAELRKVPESRLFPPGNVELLRYDASGRRLETSSSDQTSTWHPAAKVVKVAGGKVIRFPGILDDAAVIRMLDAAAARASTSGTLDAAALETEASDAASRKREEQRAALEARMSLLRRVAEALLGEHALRTLLLSALPPLLLYAGLFAAYAVVRWLTRGFSPTPPAGHSLEAG